MCRLVAYLGEDILLSDVLIKPVNSLIKQSLQSQESTTLTNGDGVGLGWYVPKISPDPGLYTSVIPAWSNRNLIHLAQKTLSPAFFAHVRAATSGEVSQLNCHPFVYQQWMFMHNGKISDFLIIKRHLRRLLDDDIYDWMQGDTDSEHIFALFLHLSKKYKTLHWSSIPSLFQKTFHIISHLLKERGKEEDSDYNICLTDGIKLFALRYATSQKRDPETLYIYTGPPFGLKNNKPKRSTIIASEKLTESNTDWNLIPANHFYMIHKNNAIESKPLAYLS